jgi:hypothetical protein
MIYDLYDMEFNPNFTCVTYHILNNYNVGDL